MLRGRLRSKRRACKSKRTCKTVVTAEAKVVKAGSTVGYVECEVKDQTGKLVARVKAPRRALRSSLLVYLLGVGPTKERRRG
jgi:positive regulator of sigma E activity